MASNLNIAESLENKTILITGATGFLGKIFLEKVLRAQPNVKRIFLVMRASTDKSVKERLQHEVTGNELFDVLREQYNIVDENGFAAFISENVSVIEGDVADENLGILDTSLLELLFDQIDAVVNIAATTKFDERYDVALAINTLGTKHVMDFSKKCSNLDVLLHVSTAYVAGERSGIISEEPLRVGEGLNGQTDLDIESEVQLAMTQLCRLRKDGATKVAEKIAMKELGIQRARHYGWPNTYVFTKSMGEMIVGKYRGELPVAIMRPTIITSTIEEPFPGWLEGNRTIDSFLTAYAKGNLSFILGDPKLVMDVIPGDYVVNAMLGIMACHQTNHRRSDDEYPMESYVYHVGSSSRNPVMYDVLEESAFRYLSLVKGKNKIKRVRFCTTKEKFDFQMKLSYKMPLEILHAVDVVFFKLLKTKYSKLKKKYNYMMRLADLYKPYTFFNGIFNDNNVGRLLRATGEEEKEFDFDVKNINWEEYFTRVHIPSVLKRMAN